MKLKSCALQYFQAEIHHTKEAELLRARRSAFSAPLIITYQRVLFNFKIASDENLQEHVQQFLDMMTYLCQDTSKSCYKVVGVVVVRRVTKWKWFSELEAACRHTYSQNDRSS